MGHSAGQPVSRHACPPGSGGWRRIGRASFLHACRRAEHGVREIGGAGLPRKIPLSTPSPPGISASLFSILCPQSIHNTQLSRCRNSLLLNTLRDSRQSIHNKSLRRFRKSLLLNTLRDSCQSILSKVDTRKVFRKKDLSGAEASCRVALFSKSGGLSRRAAHVSAPIGRTQPNIQA